MLTGCMSRCIMRWSCTSIKRDARNFRKKKYQEDILSFVPTSFAICFSTVKDTQANWCCVLLFFIIKIFVSDSNPCSRKLPLMSDEGVSKWYNQIKFNTLTWWEEFHRHRIEQKWVTSCYKDLSTRVLKNLLLWAAFKKSSIAHAPKTKT